MKSDAKSELQAELDELQAATKSALAKKKN
jgi:hypothetical protein